MTVRSRQALANLRRPIPYRCNSQFRYKLNFEQSSLWLAHKFWVSLSCTELL
jgi:hypothetical protein